MPISAQKYQPTAIELLAPVPRGWNALPSNHISAVAGDAWIRAARSLALIVPSVIVPGQRNILINPAHPRFAELRVDAPITYTIDARLMLRAALIARAKKK